MPVNFSYRISTPPIVKFNAYIIWTAIEEICWLVCQILDAKETLPRIFLKILTAGLIENPFTQIDISSRFRYVITQLSVMMQYEKITIKALMSYNTNRCMTIGLPQVLFYYILHIRPLQSWLQLVRIQLMFTHFNKRVRGDLIYLGSATTIMVSL